MICQQQVSWFWHLFYSQYRHSSQELLMHLTQFRELTNNTLYLPSLSFSGCPNNTQILFQCGGSISICLERSQVCDGIPDCPNGVDESFSTCSTQPQGQGWSPHRVVNRLCVWSVLYSDLICTLQPGNGFLSNWSRWSDSLGSQAFGSSCTDLWLQTFLSLTSLLLYANVQTITRCLVSMNTSCQDLGECCVTKKEVRPHYNIFRGDIHLPILSL
jgi:hypothetical protein